MSFRPRHYILLVVILALFVVNLYRRRHLPPPVAPGTVRVSVGPAPQNPAWSAFDHATSLRDAPDTAFQPALADLRHQLTTTSDADSVSQINGCLTWLEFYRQGALHPAVDPQWKQRSERHLNGCTRFHADTTA